MDRNTAQGAVRDRRRPERRPLALLAVLVLAASLSTASGGAVAASDASARAAAFVRTLVDQAYGLIGARDLSPERLERALDRFVAERFDMRTIGRFGLGRFWSRATPAERERYLALLQGHMVRGFLRRFGRYAGAPSTGRRGLRVDRVLAVQGDHIVQTRIDRSGGAPVRVGWRLRKTGSGRLKVIDVIIEGISLATVQRRGLTATAALNGGRVGAVIDALEKRTRAPCCAVASSE